MAITFHEYDKQAETTAVYPGKGSNLIYPTLGLLEEAGEVAGKMSKMIRDDGGVLTDERRALLIKEMGDVLWFLSALARELGVSLEEVAKGNLDKLASRKERKVLNGDGDNR